MVKDNNSLKINYSEKKLQKELLIPSNLKDWKNLVYLQVVYKYKENVTNYK